MAFMIERAKILLVDDRPENLLALEAILSSLDQTLVRAGSGEEALRALLKDDYALILLDAQMPGMDGFETAARIKRRSRTKDVPIIFLTAADNEQRNSYRGYAAGGADYIAKPFDPWILRAKVQVFVDLWAAGRRLASQASFLRRQIDDQEDSADVLGVLRDQVAEVSSATEGLEQALTENDLAGVREATERVRQQVDDLHDSIAALQSTATTAGLTRREFG
ncbi:CheY-like chemotaxis protein/DNA-binding FrmR family transcriptional regulator [Nocardioides ginsengisegetis]|uniref:CheY-like chemotaxis protein/DNA-binding FrmR family transcriptional regulator n=2 Tax=Nocardioides ginsengisegetis TaxID=661491 RepID=A0A7W3J1B7_9ACTN|nr:CheY-like chemotaxis protein/DNA-binding FrmR family transcriptional regulator [Nocardioides ginsengisegetis]